ncbi:pyridoxal-phosphate dependent enzyme [Symbioplanes lichenis]|uniref:pyridoxal-phosphate dependent enzyme n=1 Tax=Symbioplanes lichenis TaxID=1629072 RepID=UPI0034DB5A88
MPASRSAGVDASAFAPGSTPVPSSAPAPAPVPDVVVACVGGGSNAAGTFTAFTGTTARLVGVEAAGGAAMSHGTPGVVHGTRSMVLQDEAGQIAEAHSIAAGLDYPGVGPEHAHWGTSGQATYVTVTDDEVVAALTTLARTEGIICALESAHAVAWVLRAAGTPDLPHGSTVLLTLSGRGDKDMAQLAEASLLDPPQPPTARPPTPDKPAPDAVRPPLPSSNAFSPNVTPLHEVSPDAVSLHEVSPNAVSPNAVSPNAVSPDVAAPARKARP